MVNSRIFKSICGLLALLFAAGTHSAAPAKIASTPAQSETTSLKVTCKVFVTEAGIPKSVEVVKIEPPIAPSDQEVQKQAVVKSLQTWTFTPNQKNGKPVAGYLIVPVIVDLASPLPVSGT